MTHSLVTSSNGGHSAAGGLTNSSPFHVGNALQTATLWL